MLLPPSNDGALHVQAMDAPTESENVERCSESFMLHAETAESVNIGTEASTGGGVRSWSGRK